MNKKFLKKRVDDELMLYDTEQDVVHILNTTAEKIYELHQENRSLKEIEEVFLESFEIVDREKLQQDIRNLIAEIEKKEIDR